MAGLFGLFDYNKVGPGVSKNAPQKRSFVVFFEIYIRKFWKLVEISLLAVLPTVLAIVAIYSYHAAFSMPPLWMWLLVGLMWALTIGPVNTGFTYITRNYTREKHAFLSDFFDAIKKNRKQAVLVGFINSVAQVMMAYAMWFYYPAAENGASVEWTAFIPFAIVLAANVLFLFMQYYIYLLIVTFKFSMRQLYRNSFIFAVAGMKQNLLISVVLLLVYGLLVLIACINEIGLITAVLLALIIEPGFRMLLIQFTVFPMVKKWIIDPYYEEHPDEDVEKRADLALEISKPETDEEPIFEDRGNEKVSAPPQESTVRTFPRQYSEEQLRRGGTRLTLNGQDDDDTI